MFARALSLLLGLVSLGLGMVVFLRVVLLSMMSIVALYLPWSMLITSSVCV